MIELLSLTGELIFMINHIVTAIDNIVQRKREFINSETAYTRVSPWTFDRNVNFQIFRQRTTTRHDINIFHLESMNHSYKKINRGNYSRRRQYIDAEFYKEVNREFLKQIKYLENSNKDKTYKGYHLYAVDGLTLSFDNDKKNLEMNLK